MISLSLSFFNLCMYVCIYKYYICTVYNIHGKYMVNMFGLYKSCQIPCNFTFHGQISCKAHCSLAAITFRNCLHVVSKTQHLTAMGSSQAPTPQP